MGKHEAIRSMLAPLAATAVAGVLLAIAIEATSLAMARPDPAFIALGAVGVSDSSGNVRLRLSLQDATGADLDGTLRIGYQAGEATKEIYSTGVRVGSRADGAFEILLPDACGIRLLIAVDANGSRRALSLVAPCIAT